MFAEFVVNTCFKLSDLGLVASGEVTEGEISEGAQGKTPKGKVFTLVKIDIHGEHAHTIHKNDKANLFIKNIDFSEIRPGATLYFY
jgi:hypothetical protein